VAWASLQEPATTLTTFAAIGAGMALPYQVLATFPGLVERMPRTGPASVVIKQVMGLLMLAAAAYFVGVGVSGLVVASPDPPTRAYWWFVAGFGTAAGAWLAYRSFRITRSWVRRAAFGGLGAAIAVVSAGIGLRLTNSGPIDWVYYTPQRLEEALDAGNVVVVEFTAEWCLNCHALEQGVLHRPELVEVLGGPGVVPMKVDLTGNNAAGNEMLTRVVGRRTIPLLVVFAPDRTEVFKQDFYTASQVLNAVREARSRTAAAGPAAGTTPAGAG
jgi:thiol:disulfide interchange protein DsbD